MRAYTLTRFGLTPRGTALVLGFTVAGLALFLAACRQLQHLHALTDVGLLIVYVLGFISSGYGVHVIQELTEETTG